MIVSGLEHLASIFEGQLSRPMKRDVFGARSLYAFQDEADP
jgi:hypothetical protein